MIPAIRKRKFGYLLLSLLVISGFAGAPGNYTITKAERKQAISLLKQTRNDLLQATEKLSETQLNYKTSPKSLSIKECIYRIAIEEYLLWDRLSGTTSHPAGDDVKPLSSFRDQDILEGKINPVLQEPLSNNTDMKGLPWNSPAAALEFIKETRPKQINYTRTTTEDLRNHIIKTDNGEIDTYQLILLLSIQTSKLIREIESIKKSSRFPEY